MKRCFKCGITKPLTEFYAHKYMADGRLNKCKPCARKDVAENYRANIEHYIAYEQQRFKRPERKKQIAKYLENSRKGDRQRERARYLTSNAIRDGRLIRQPCAVCGDERSEAHHDDYSKPLDVRWLCRVHHLQVHGKTAYSVAQGLNT